MQQHPDHVVFLTESETARLLRLSERTMQRLRKRGDGPPYVRLGSRRVVYSRGHVVAWAEAHLWSSKTEEQESRHAQPSI